LTTDSQHQPPRQAPGRPAPTRLHCTPNWARTHGPAHAQAPWPACVLHPRPRPACTQARTHSPPAPRPRPAPVQTRSHSQPYKYVVTSTPYWTRIHGVNRW